MTQLLLDNPVLLLMAVAATGYVVGEIRILGANLGASAVLFAGIAFGALHPEMRLPEVITTIGLVFFLYTIGLSNGPAFFTSFRKKGLRDSLLVVGVIGAAALLTLAVHFALGLNGRVTAGLFAGSLTNTPALAGTVEFLKTNTPPEMLEAVLDDPVIGYSIAYPMGVIGMIAAILLAQRWWKIDYGREARELGVPTALDRPLANRTIRVTREEATRAPLHDLVNENRWDVLFGRMKRNDGRVVLADPVDYVEVGALITVIGAPEDVERVTRFFGVLSDEQLVLDRSDYDFRRVFISNPRIAGHRLRDLNLFQQFGAIITRIRRGDVEWLAHDDTTLELGDRVRVVARPDAMSAVSRFLGDSYRALSEINLLTFSLGIMAGLLIGLIPVPVPGGLTFKLGFAGGPLLVGLVLGRIGRTGSLFWHLSYSGNMLLRQIGLVLFFAGVGTRAGYTFVETLGQAGGPAIFLGGIVVTCSSALLMLWTGYRVLGIPMSRLTGMLAGLQTQTAVLSVALDQSRNDLPNAGYATVYPVATIAKIIAAQLLLIFLT